MLKGLFATDGQPGGTETPPSDICLLSDKSWPLLDPESDYWLRLHIESHPALRFSAFGLEPSGRDPKDCPANPKNLSDVLCAMSIAPGPGPVAFLRPGSATALAKALKDFVQTDPDRGEPALLAWAELTRAASRVAGRLDAERFVDGEANWRAMVTAHAVADLGIPLAEFQAFWDGFALHLLRGLLTPAPKARVFHALGLGMAGAVGAYNARVSGAPLLIQDDGRTLTLPIDASGPLGPVRRRLERLLARVALAGASAVSTANGLRRDYLIGLGAAPDRITIVPHGVPAAPQERGLRHDRPLIAFANPRQTATDRTICLRIAAEIKRATPDAEFLLYMGSEGTPGAEFEGTLADFGLSNALQCVSAIGPAPAVERADLLIFADARESLPPAALLAGAQGLCVLSGALNAASALLTDETVLRDGTVRDFADAAVSLLKNPSARTAAGRKLHERVERHHSLGKTLAAYDRLYRGLLDRANLKAPAKEAA